MSIVARLIHFAKVRIGRPLSAHGPSAPSDDQLAAAALLVHVARVDGVMADEEGRRVLGLLEARFGLTPSQARDLMVQADELDRETDDIADLVEMLGPAGEGSERERLLAMAYAVASADGVLHEFEQDLAWRVGRLLGFRDSEIERVKADTLPATLSETARS